MAEKIAKGKLAKFLNDNSLLNQIWIMDTKKKVSDILKENEINNELKVIKFVKYKVGEEFNIVSRNLMKKIIHQKWIKRFNHLKKTHPL